MLFISVTKKALYYLTHDHIVHEEMITPIEKIIAPETPINDRVVIIERGPTLSKRIPMGIWVNAKA